MKSKYHKIYLLLGSNMDEPVIQLKIATKLIEKKIGTIERASAVYETAAWGKTKQPSFLNQVLVLSTQLDPFALMNTILTIEKDMGRIRKRKYDARTIDIDILFYDKEHIQGAQLSIPHPLMSERRFVLTPLNELSPLLIHPVLKKPIHLLLKDCKDKLSVKKIIG